MLRKRLTPQQALFVVAFLETGNATRAYIEAGFTAKNERVARTNASRLLTYDNVKHAIATAQRASQAMATVTVDTIVAELDEIVRHAHACDPPQLGAASQAVLGKAKVLGLVVQRKVVDVVHHKPGLTAQAIELTEDEWSRQFAPQSKQRLLPDTSNER